MSCCINQWLFWQSRITLSLTSSQYALTTCKAAVCSLSMVYSCSSSRFFSMSRLQLTPITLLFILTASIAHQRHSPCVPDSSSNTPFLSGCFPHCPALTWFILHHCSTSSAVSLTTSASCALTGVGVGSVGRQVRFGRGVVLLPCQVHSLRLLCRYSSIFQIVYDQV